MGGGSGTEAGDPLTGPPAEEVVPGPSQDDGSQRTVETAEQEGETEAGPSVPNMPPSTLINPEQFITVENKIATTLMGLNLGTGEKEATIAEPPRSRTPPAERTKRLIAQINAIRGPGRYVNQQEFNAIHAKQIELYEMGWRSRVVDDAKLRGETTVPLADFEKLKSMFEEQNDREFGLHAKATDAERRAVAAGKASKAAIEDAKQRIEAAEGMASQRAEEIENLTEKLDKSEKDNAKLTKDLDELRTRTESEASAHKAKIQELEAKLLEQAKALEDCKAHRASAAVAEAKKVRQLEEEKVRLQTEKAELEDALEESQARRSPRTSETDLGGHSVSDSASDSQTGERDIHVLRHQVVDLTKENVALKENLVRADDRDNRLLQQEVERLEHKNRQLTRIHDVCDIPGSRHGMDGLLHDQVTELGLEVTRLQKNKHDLENRLSRMARIEQRWSRVLRALNINNDKLRAQVRRMSTMETSGILVGDGDLAKELSDLRDENQELNRRLFAADDLLGTSQNHEEQALLQIHFLEVELEDVKAQLDRNKNEGYSRDVWRTLDATTRQNDELARQNEQLLEKLDDTKPVAGRSVLSLRKDHLAIMARNKELERQLSDLQVRLLEEKKKKDLAGKEYEDKISKLETDVKKWLEIVEAQQAETDMILYTELGIAEKDLEDMKAKFTDCEAHRVKSERDARDYRDELLARSMHTGEGSSNLQLLLTGAQKQLQSIIDHEKEWSEKNPGGGEQNDRTRIWYANRIAQANINIAEAQAALDSETMKLKATHAAAASVDSFFAFDPRAKTPRGMLEMIYELELENSKLRNFGSEEARQERQLVQEKLRKSESLLSSFTRSAARDTADYIGELREEVRAWQNTWSSGLLERIGPDGLTDTQDTVLSLTVRNLALEERLETKSKEVEELKKTHKNELGARDDTIEQLELAELDRASNDPLYGSSAPGAGSSSKDSKVKALIEEKLADMKGIVEKAYQESDSLREQLERAVKLQFEAETEYQVSEAKLDGVRKELEECRRHGASADEPLSGPSDPGLANSGEYQGIAQLRAQRDRFDAERNDLRRQLIELRQKYYSSEEVGGPLEEVTELETVKATNELLISQLSDSEDAREKMKFQLQESQHQAEECQIQLDACQFRLDECQHQLNDCHEHKAMAAKEAADRQKQLEQLQARNAALKKKLSGSEEPGGPSHEEGSELEAVTTTNNPVDVELSSVKNERQKIQKQLKECQKQLEDCHEHKNKAAKQAAERQKQLDECLEHKKKVAKEAADRQKQLKELQASNAALKKRLDDCEEHKRKIEEQLGGDPPNPDPEPNAGQNRRTRRCCCLSCDWILERATRFWAWIGLIAFLQNVLGWLRTQRQNLVHALPTAQQRLDDAWAATWLWLQLTALWWMGRPRYFLNLFYRYPCSWGFYVVYDMVSYLFETLAAGLQWGFNGAIAAIRFSLSLLQWTFDRALAIMHSVRGSIRWFVFGWLLPTLDWSWRFVNMPLRPTTAVLQIFQPRRPLRERLRRPLDLTILELLSIFLLILALIKFLLAFVGVPIVRIVFRVSVETVYPAPGASWGVLDWLRVNIPLGWQQAQGLLRDTRDAVQGGGPGTGQPVVGPEEIPLPAITTPSQVWVLLQALHELAGDNTWAAAILDFISPIFSMLAGWIVAPFTLLLRAGTWLVASGLFAMGFSAYHAHNLYLNAVDIVTRLTSLGPTVLSWVHSLLVTTPISIIGSVLSLIVGLLNFGGAVVTRTADFVVNLALGIVGYALSVFQHGARSLVTSVGNILIIDEVVPFFGLERAAATATATFSPVFTGVANTVTEVAGAVDGAASAVNDTLAVGRAWLTTLFYTWIPAVFATVGNRVQNFGQQVLMGARDRLAPLFADNGLYHIAAICLIIWLLRFLWDYHYGVDDDDDTAAGLDIQFCPPYNGCEPPTSGCGSKAAYHHPPAYGGSCGGVPPAANPCGGNSSDQPAKATKDDKIKADMKKIQTEKAKIRSDWAALHEYQEELEKLRDEFYRDRAKKNSEDKGEKAAKPKTQARDYEGRWEYYDPYTGTYCSSSSDSDPGDEEFTSMFPPPEPPAVRIRKHNEEIRTRMSDDPASEAGRIAYQAETYARSWLRERDEGVEVPKEDWSNFFYTIAEVTFTDARLVERYMFLRRLVSCCCELTEADLAKLMENRHLWEAGDRVLTKSDLDAIQRRFAAGKPFPFDSW